jgi:hypothetical protein
MYEQSQEPAGLEGAFLRWAFLIMTLELVWALLFLLFIAVGMTNAVGIVVVIVVVNRGPCA